MIQADAPEKCALGLDARALSAWRDGAATERKAAHIAGHVGGCPACQAHLAAFESVAEAVQRQRLPGPRPTLWREIQQRRAHTTPLRWRRPHIPRAPLWSGAGAAAAALLVALLFAQILSGRLGGTTSLSRTISTPSGTAVSTTAPTPTLAQTGSAGALTWQQVTNPRPTAILGPSFPVVIAVAPSDGNTAYACYSGAPPQLWVTHDRAATWAHVSSVPSTHVGCGLTVDTLDSRVVLASTYPIPPPTQPPYDNFISIDGGATWRSLGSDGGQHFTRFATYQGITVAKRDQSIALSKSTDTFVTWQPLDESVIMAHQSVERFWLNRADGSLLAQTVGSDTSGATYFWTGSALGGAWRQQGAAPRNLSDFVVQQPRTVGEAWHVCGVGYDTAPTPTSGGTTAANGNGNIPVLNDVRCSGDSGATWQERPVLAIQHTTSQAASQAIPPQGVFAITGDGTLLAVDGDDPSGGTPTLTLYVLPKSGAAWHDAGSLPGGGTLLYAPTVVGGVLWMVLGTTTTLSRGFFTAVYLFG